MKCVAVRRCQTRNDNGVIITYRKGDVDSFKECPTNFRPIEGEEAMPLNFDDAQEQELLESDFDLDELKAYIEKKYDKKPGNRGKEKTIDMLMDCRYRDLSDVDLNKVL